LKTDPKFVSQKFLVILFQSQHQSQRSIARVCFLSSPLSHSSLLLDLVFSLSSVFGPKDTAEADVFEVTFDEYEKYLPHMYKRWRE
jgi:hypothetical protein